MAKISVLEAAEILGISKEAVYNRIRRNTLNSIVEDGVKFVILDENEQIETSTKKPPQTSKKTYEDDRYSCYLLDQISELKEKVKTLEDDKDRLIMQKEELLIQTKNEIEAVYKDRDKQLKQILALVTRPLMSLVKKQRTIDANFEDLAPYDKALVESKEVSKWINLDEYMHEKGYSYKKKKSINSALLAQVNTNKNIKEENGILFIKRGKKIKQILRSKE